jgi:hypothetical protein
MPRPATYLTPDVPMAECAWCPPTGPETQFRAHLHWLRDFHQYDALKQHLLSQCTPSLQGREYTDGRLLSILAWWQSIQQDFRRDLDESGQEVRAWESWCMAQARPPCTTLPALHLRLASAGYGRQEVPL